MADFLKDYEPVEDRLRAFWSDHPDGRVMTMLIDYHQPGSYIVRAEVFTGDGLDWPSASGLAHDSVDELPPNMKQSALEVCETSAIGRALANLGYAAKGKRPSREEMSKASPAGGPAATPQGAAVGEPSTETTTDSAGGTMSPPETNAGALPNAGRHRKGGDTSLDGGEASGTVPGGQTNPPGTTKDAPGPPHYPLNPAECDHLGKSGHLLRPRKSPRGPVCPRCGLSYITVTESTSADLGSA